MCYLVLCEAGFPKKLAFAYLEDLQAEFHEQHGKRVPTVSRPYSFIEFGKKKESEGTTYLLLVVLAVILLHLLYFKQRTYISLIFKELKVIGLIYLPKLLLIFVSRPHQTPTSRKPRSRT